MSNLVNRQRFKFLLMGQLIDEEFESETTIFVEWIINSYREKTIPKLHMLLANL